MLAAGLDNRTLLVGGWCLVIVANAMFRTFRPLAYRDDIASFLRVAGEFALGTLAVLSTGRWDSPFIFSLMTAIIVAGFARGFGLALIIAAATTLTVAIPDVILTDRIRLSAQWACEYVLVAVVAGYARHISGEADRQQSLALDRLGRLSDANALLFSLHRVAQTLPASLDLDEALDTTMGRIRDLFDTSVAALLLFDETDSSWTVARRDGARLPPSIRSGHLPPPLARAVSERMVVHERNLSAVGTPGLVPTMGSGLYTVLLARESVIGLVALEHQEADHFTARDGELLDGFAEPAALAIDNARWFARLRTVGAEEERTRIARDLHDRIGQSLAYLAFELDRIVKRETTGEPVGEALEQLRRDIRDVIRDVRDTLYDLRTDVSEGSGIRDVMDVYLQRVRDRSGMEIAFRSQENLRLPLLQERELFRIAQEAIANVEKHADASMVTVSWHSTGRGAVLEVRDNGQGFPMGTAGRLDSYGIVGMRERASSIGAMLDIQSTPGAGTKVRCTVGSPPTRPPLIGLRRAAK